MKTTPRPISFRPTAQDQEIIDKFPEGPTEVIRRGLRLLDHEFWLEQFHHDAKQVGDWNPNSEQEAW